ncbi:MAG TPA: hypothetical protein VMB49_01390 [Acidobacteriaceae bacterium]|nr:hypothetical protein [Acidobacteriaceae bacterium]
MNYLEALRHLLNLFPLQVFAAGLIPVLQFARERFRSLQVEQRKQHLRAKLVGLNAFISSMQELPPNDQFGQVCIEDAVREREGVLRELAASIARESARQKHIRPRRWMPWLLLLYHPPRPSGWALRWSFFALLFVSVAATVRGILHENYFPLRVLVPFVVTCFVLAMVVRLAALRIEGVRA